MIRETSGAKRKCPAESELSTSTGRVQLWQAQALMQPSCKATIHIQLGSLLGAAGGLMMFTGQSLSTWMHSHNRECIS